MARTPPKPVNAPEREMQNKHLLCQRRSRCIKNPFISGPSEADRAPTPQHQNSQKPTVLEEILIQKQATEVSLKVSMPTWMRHLTHDDERMVTNILLAYHYLCNKWNCAELLTLKGLNEILMVDAHVKIFSRWCVWLIFLFLVLCNFKSIMNVALRSCGDGCWFFHVNVHCRHLTRPYLILDR